MARSSAASHPSLSSDSGSESEHEQDELSCPSSPSTTTPITWSNNPIRDMRLLDWLDAHPDEARFIFSDTPKTMTKLDRAAMGTPLSKIEYLAEAASEIFGMDEDQGLRDEVEKDVRRCAQGVYTRLRYLKKKYQDVNERLGPETARLEWEGIKALNVKRFRAIVETLPAWKRLHVHWRTLSNYNQFWEGAPLMRFEEGKKPKTSASSSSHRRATAKRENSAVDSDVEILHETPRAFKRENTAYIDVPPLPWRTRKWLPTSETKGGLRGRRSPEVIVIDSDSDSADETNAPPRKKRPLKRLSRRVVESEPVSESDTREEETKDLGNREEPKSNEEDDWDWLYVTETESMSNSKAEVPVMPNPSGSTSKKRRRREVADDKADVDTTSEPTLSEAERKQRKKEKKKRRKLQEEADAMLMMEVDHEDAKARASADVEDTRDGEGEDLDAEENERRAKAERKAARAERRALREAAQLEEEREGGKREGSSHASAKDDDGGDMAMEVDEGGREEIGEEREKKKKKDNIDEEKEKKKKKKKKDRVDVDRQEGVGEEKEKEKKKRKKDKVDEGEREEVGKEKEKRKKKKDKGMARSTEDVPADDALPLVLGEQLAQVQLRDHPTSETTTDVQDSRPNSSKAHETHMQSEPRSRWQPHPAPHAHTGRSDQRVLCTSSDSVSASGLGITRLHPHRHHPYANERLDHQSHSNRPQYHRDQQQHQGVPKGSNALPISAPLPANLNRRPHPLPPKPITTTAESGPVAGPSNPWWRRDAQTYQGGSARGGPSSSSSASQRQPNPRSRWPSRGQLQRNPHPGTNSNPKHAPRLNQAPNSKPAPATASTSTAAPATPATQDHEMELLAYKRRQLELDAQLARLKLQMEERERRERFELALKVVQSGLLGPAVGGVLNGLGVSVGGSGPSAASGGGAGGASGSSSTGKGKGKAKQNQKTQRAGGGGGNGTGAASGDAAKNSTQGKKKKKKKKKQNAQNTNTVARSSTNTSSHTAHDARHDNHPHPQRTASGSGRGDTSGPVHRNTNGPNFPSNGNTSGMDKGKGKAKGNGKG